MIFSKTPSMDAPAINGTVGIENQNTDAKQRITINSGIFWICICAV